MKFKTLKFWLPLSYAAIALLAALSLGVLLLATLRGYYSRLESEYLLQNAQSMELAISPLLHAEAPTTTLQAQVEILGLFSQARLRLYDQEGDLLADSGDPGRREVVTFITSRVVAQEDQVFDITINNPSASEEPRAYLFRDEEGATSSGAVIVRDIPQVIELDATPVTSETTWVSGVYSASQTGILTTIPTVNTFFGIGLNPEVQSNARRSNLSVEHQITDLQGGTIATLELSQGPAYGWEIVYSVALAWLAASGFAILVASLVGWAASRRITRPLGELTDVTAHMAQGNLSARAATGRADELGRLANSFNEMAEQVEETVETLRQFAADAAHELQTPLTALQTNLELLESGVAGDDGRVQLQRAREQVTRLKDLNQGLLELSRLETGSHGYEPTRFDLAEMLNRLAEVYAARAEHKEQHFESRIPEAPVPVLADQALTESAVGNLLENAVKFTPPGGEIELELEVDEAEVRIRVQDSGIGIPPDELGQLFNRFHRARNAAGYPGSGLGLAIVRAVADLHGGQARIHARQEGGTRAMLCLPRRLED